MLAIAITGFPLSSPRTRGRQTAFGAWHCSSPFIPAYTGQTLRTRGKTVGDAFHPRVHGADALILDFGEGFSLSSPRTRGRPCQGPCDQSLAPFIPAYTGQTQSRNTKKCRFAFHPRVHGADSGPKLYQSRFSLSSPRTRGRRDFLQDRQLLFPFIPAYTGQTLSLIA